MTPIKRRAHAAAILGAVGAFRHVLVATDGSARSARAAVAGARLARRLGARLSAVHVLAAGVPTLFSRERLYVTGVVGRRWRAQARRQSDAVLGAAQAAFTAAGVSGRLLRRVAPAPWMGIVRAARARRCDLIVMASHGGRGSAARLLASETMKVLAHSRVPVLVCR
ncbi:MAG: universal stress protein [Betaproteobacteria bacterium]|nr:universal stress protein [Betaproteobacteria bacterium]